MPSRTIAISILCAMLAAAGCKRSVVPQPLPLESVEASALIRDTPIVFLSWDGKWMGTDIDTELTLNPDGTATVSYYGYAHNKIAATWKIDGDQLLISAPFTQLIEMPGAKDWPPLTVKKRNHKLVLVPTRQTEALKYSGVSGWPLAEIDAGSLGQRAANEIAAPATGAATLPMETLA